MHVDNMPNMSSVLKEACQQDAAVTHLYSEQGKLQCIGGGKAWQQPALVSQVGDDELLIKLGSHACVSDGDSQSHFGAVHCTLGNQNASSCETSNLYMPFDYRIIRAQIPG